jgi:hypothetical protein
VKTRLGLAGFSDCVVSLRTWGKRVRFFAKPFGFIGKSSSRGRVCLNRRRSMAAVLFRLSVGYPTQIVVFFKSGHSQTSPLRSKQLSGRTFYCTANESPRALRANGQLSVYHDRVGDAAYR